MFKSQRKGMLPFSDLGFATLIKHVLEGKTPGYRLIDKEYFRIRYVSRSGGLPWTLFYICGYFLVQFSGCIYGCLKGVGFLKRVITATKE